MNHESQSDEKDEKEAINELLQSSSKYTIWNRISDRKPENRKLFVIVMCIFVAFVMVWGICQNIRYINLEGHMPVSDTTKQTVKDNSENAGKALDVEKLISKILDEVAFEAKLEKLEDSVASGMIITADDTSLQIYMGNGTYADELVVMTAKNEEDAKKNQENVKKHLEEMKTSFQDYIPKETKKIDNAVTVRCGCYVIVCITSDFETAQKVIDAAIKE